LNEKSCTNTCLKRREWGKVLKRAFLLSVLLAIVSTIPSPTYVSNSDINGEPPAQWTCSGTGFVLTADSRTDYADFNSTLQFIKNFQSDLDFYVLPGDMDVVQTNKEAYTDVELPDLSTYWVRGNHENEEDVTYIESLYPSLPNTVSKFDNKTYSFSYANVHFIVLDEYVDHPDGRIEENSALFNWTRSELENTDKSLQIFVVGHEPAYPKHRHVGDSLDQFPADRDSFWKLLNDNSVEAYFCGHTHYYSMDDSHLNVAQIDVGNARWVNGGGGGDGNSTVVVGYAHKSYTNITVFQSVTDSSHSFTLRESYIINNPHSSLKGDIDGDCDVDVIDLYLFSKAYGTSPPSNLMADFDEDSDVDPDDFHIFVGNYGKTLVYVELTPIDPNLTSPSGTYRWLDAADQAYSIDYRNNYNYSQACVEVAYVQVGEKMEGTLTASNLKPNFAYQLKLVGTSDDSDNERIGLVGRWWQEVWDGLSWSNGQNLNNKGDGSSPNPNDLVYFERRYIENPSSPTGYHYRYTGYLVLDYFVTDSNGATTLHFETGSCYHVLWKTSQRSNATNDGPVKIVTFDPDPSEPAYDVDYPSSTVSIFGEWERLPMGGVHLQLGEYNCQMILTEESFHGSGGSLAGNWAGAMSADIELTITD